MTSVFIIYRSNYYRYFSRIIESHFRQGASIEVWLGGSEIIEPPFEDELKKNLRLIEFSDEIDLSKKIRESKNIDLFFSLHPFPGKLDEEIHSKINNKWAILMHGIDSYLEIRDWHLNHKNKYLESDYVRHFFPYSKYIHQIGLDWLVKYKTEDSKENCNFFSSEKTLTHFSEAPFISASSGKLSYSRIKQKYSLDSEKKVLLYLPFPFSSGRYDKPISNALHAAFSGINHPINFEYNGFSFQQVPKNIMSLLRRIKNILLILRFHESRKIYFKETNELAVIEQIRKFCDTNNFAFVVKGRKKFSIPQNLSELADLVVLGDEDQQNPSEFQELSQISDLTIGYTTTSVFETLFYNVPFINISFPKEFYGYGEYSYEMHSSREGYIYNHQGAVTNFSYDDFIFNFSTLDPSTFQLEPESENEYRKRYLGLDFLFDDKDYIDKVINKN